MESQKKRKTKILKTLNICWHTVGIYCVPVVVVVFSQRVCQFTNCCAVDSIEGTVPLSAHSIVNWQCAYTITVQCFCSANSRQRQGGYFQCGIVRRILHIQKGFERLILTFPTEMYVIWFDKHQPYRDVFFINT